MTFRGELKEGAGDSDPLYVLALMGAIEELSYLLLSP